MDSIARIKTLSVILALLVLVGGATFFGSTLSAAHAATGATIKFSSISAPPGGSVTISGSRFGASETVIIQFDGTQVGTATTSTTGAFATTITIPTSAQPGNHSVQATGQSSGLTAIASFMVATNWPMFGFNVQHTHLNPYENVLNSSNVSGLVSDWTAFYNITSPPTIYNGEIYVGTSSNCCSNGSLVALDEKTGKSNFNWTFSAGFIIGAPLVVNNIVYFTSQDGHVYALNAQTGATKWSFSLPQPTTIESSPAYANGSIYFGADDENVYSLNASTGAEQWSYKTGSIVQSSPAVVNGVVYVGSYDQNVYALNAKTGALKWKYTTGNSIYGSPAVVNGIVYVGSQDFRIYALDALRGTLKWRYSTGNQVNGSPAVANGIVYINSLDQNLYALDAITGVLKWVTSTGDSQAAPAVANGVVYISFKALDAQSGALLWSAGPNADSSPVVVDGTLFTYTYNGGLYAFHLPA